MGGESRAIQLLNLYAIIKTININKILKAIQNVAHIGVLKQRWEEIKKSN